MQKKINLTLSILLLVFAFLITTPVYADDNLSINSTSVELYALSEKYQSKISIPSDFPQSFQLKVSNFSGTVEYAVTEGDSVEVSNSGLITPKVNILYWISKAAPKFSFAQTTLKCDTKEKQIINPLNAETDGTLSFASSNKEIAEIDSTGTITLKKAGSCTITVSSTEGKNYNAGSSSYELIVTSLLQQNITAAKSITKTYGDKGFSLNAKTDANVPLSYKSSNKKVTVKAKKNSSRLYDKFNCEKDIIVMDGNKTLKEDVDYEIRGGHKSGSGNKLKKATVKLKGVGNYTGTYEIKIKL